MRDVWRRFVLADAISKLWNIEPTEKMLPGAQKHWGYAKMHLVNEASG
jgi:hypothetical protein